MDSERKETPRDRFVRLAERRVTKALKSIQLVGNLSNRTNYEYSDEDVKRMFDALSAELRRARACYKDAQEEGNQFRL